MKKEDTTLNKKKSARNLKKKRDRKRRKYPAEKKERMPVARRIRLYARTKEAVRIIEESLYPLLFDAHRTLCLKNSEKVVLGSM